jgi:hypothetical protein
VLADEGVVRHAGLTDVMHHPLASLNDRYSAVGLTVCDYTQSSNC